jgi:hypothetical protein
MTMSVTVRGFVPDRPSLCSISPSTGNSQSLSVVDVQLIHRVAFSRSACDTLSSAPVAELVDAAPTAVHLG